MFHFIKVDFLKAGINVTMSTPLCHYLKLDTWVLGVRLIGMKPSCWSSFLPRCVGLKFDWRDAVLSWVTLEGCCQKGKR